MQKRSSLKRFFPALTPLMLLPIASRAGATDRPIEAGPSCAAPQNVPTGLNGDRFFIKALKDRSYCCQVRTQSYVEAAFLAGVSLLGSPVPYQARGESEPVWDTDEYNQYASKNRLCFIAPQDGSYALPLYFDYLPNRPSNTLQVQCTETTIFGGFNTVVNQINFLELNNTLRDTQLSGRLTATNAISGQKIVENYSFVVPADGRVDLALHDILGTGIFGNLVIAFDGPAGSIQANLSQYKITSTSPFAFELVARERLTPR